ncbi:hypothetical protein DERP_003620, partial [Dermatophagoides pteronyssinus]
MTLSNLIKIKISAKVNEEELKKGQKSQVNCGLYFILQILALVTLILMVIWFIENFGGLSLKMTEEHMEQFFNLHPLFMVFGLVYVVANSLLFLTSSYALRFARIVLAFIILTMGCIGSIITFYWHSENEYVHFYSLHSWLGIITWIFLITYFFYGFNVYITNIDDDRRRVRMIQHLRFIGIATLLMAGATCLLGISQNLIVRSMMKTPPPPISPEGSSIIPPAATTNNETSIDDQSIFQANLIGNTIGMFLFCYILSMIYLMARMRYEPWSMRKREQIEKQLRATVEKAMARLEEDGVLDNKKQRSSGTGIGGGSSR